MAERQPGPPWATDPSAPSLRLAVSKAGERIQEIIDTAERVAAEIRDEAERDAAMLLDQRRRDAERMVEETGRELAELTETLGARAAAVQRELGGLLEAFQNGIGRLSALGAPGEPSATISRSGAPPSTTERDPGDSLTGDALLRLTQMAVAGAGRAELERTLREEFGVTQTEPVLDQVLGPSFGDPGPRLGRFTGPARFDPPEQTG